MKGGFKSSLEWIVCLILLVQQIVTVTAVYTMAQTCAQYAQGWIADPSDCGSFGFCNNSILQGTARCPNNYMYNARRAECQSAGPDVCAVGNVCQNAADKSFMPNPSDCTTYYYCEKKVGKLLSCNANQMYDHKTTSCIWKPANANSLCPANSICRLVKDGAYLGDPDNCGQYIPCFNGVGTARKCPSGTYFNKDLGGCQTANPCQTPTPVGIGLGVLTPLAANPDICKKLKGPFPAWMSDSKTCMGYYVCLNQDGPGAWRKCDPGLHFDNGKCVNACNVPCPYDRCGNMNQQFMGTINTGCKNYLLCNNQTSQAQTYTNYVGTSCPSDNPYFDEITQRCVPTSPASLKYKLCVA